MIYVIESQGKGDSPATYVVLRTFSSSVEAADYASLNVQRNSDGFKYWTRFDIVEPGERIENYAE